MMRGIADIADIEERVRAQADQKKARMPRRMALDGDRPDKPGKDLGVRREGRDLALHGRRPPPHLCLSNKPIRVRKVNPCVREGRLSPLANNPPPT